MELGISRDLPFAYARFGLIKFWEPGADLGTGPGLVRAWRICRAGADALARRARESAPAASRVSRRILYSLVTVLGKEVGSLEPRIRSTRAATQLLQDAIVVRDGVADHHGFILLPPGRFFQIAMATDTEYVPEVSGRSSGPHPLNLNVQLW